MFTNLKNLLLSLLVLPPVFYIIWEMFFRSIVDGYCRSRSSSCSNLVALGFMSIVFIIVVLLPYWIKPKNSKGKNVHLMGILEIVISPVALIFATFFYSLAFSLTPYPPKFASIIVILASLLVSLIILFSGISKIKMHLKNKVLFNNDNKDIAKI